MSACKRCRERGKDWNGDDPVCFLDGGFGRNWNCATLNAVRDICYEGQNPMPHGVDYQYCDNMKYATIRIEEVEDGEIGMALWVAWYKNRGATDAMWILNSDEPPRIPTEDELEAIICHYAWSKQDEKDKARHRCQFEGEPGDTSQQDLDANNEH